MLLSGLCICKEARQTPVLGGGGTVAFRAAQPSGGAKTLVGAPCIRSRLGAALLNVAGPKLWSPETQLKRRRPRPSGCITHAVPLIEGRSGMLHGSARLGSLRRRSSAFVSPPPTSHPLPMSVGPVARCESAPDQSRAGTNRTVVRGAGGTALDPTSPNIT